MAQIPSAPPVFRLGQQLLLLLIDPLPAFWLLGTSISKSAPKPNNGDVNGKTIENHVEQCWMKSLGFPISLVKTDEKLATIRPPSSPSWP